MQPYAVYINQEALKTAPRSGPQRRMVMEFVRSLGISPHTKGDFSERDDTGRIIQIKVVGRYAITFWADHAVSEIKVTHIKAADC